MGTTKVKVIDESVSDQSKKAQKQAKAKPVAEEAKKPVTTEVTENKTGDTEDSVSVQSVSRTEPKTSSKSAVARKTKQAKSKVRSKRYQDVASIFQKDKTYPLISALEIAKKTSKTKFTGSVDAHLVLKKSFRANIAFPHAVKTKEEKVLIFAPASPDPLRRVGDEASASRGGPIIDKAPSNVIFGDEKTIAQISENKLVAGRDFNKVFSTPQFMAQLAKVAKTLGPKGLMPNPKNETIIKSADDAIKNLNSGLVEIKTQQDQP
ncbi:MAG TPA: hypothetical protein VIK81_00840, partial [Patescibacteria group bacterium]